MIDVVLIGHGNVGSHLAQKILNTDGIRLRQLFSTRKIKSDNYLESIRTSVFTELVNDAHIYILAIPDDLIPIISGKLPVNNALVVHTSGSASMQLLDKKNRRGVFYPLQTFSKGANINFSEVPICIEADQASDIDLLKIMANLVSNKVSEISSKERKHIHVAAVFVNNFVNELYHISEDIMKSHNLDFDLLKPLILETANKIQTISPEAAQTGPAIRKDYQTIERHLNALDDESQKKVYKLLTDRIVKRECTKS